MLKKSLLFLIAITLLASVSGFSTTLTNYNSTLATVNITNTTDLYAYEINIDYPGSAIIDVDQTSYQFLGQSGSEATYGYNEKDSVLSVYGSRLNASRIGVNGSGILFNVSHYGPITLRYTLEIYGNGTEIYTYYNNTESPSPEEDDDGGGGGGGGGGGSGSKPQEFKISPDLLQITLKQGKTSRQIITLDNLKNKQIQITEIDGGSVQEFIAAFVPNTPFYIPNGGETDITMDFFTSTETIPDVYTGEIEFVSPTSTESLNTIIEVLEEEPLFDLIVDLEKDEYFPGEVVMATIDIQNFGDLQNIDVLLRYSLKNFDGEEIAFEEGSYAIQNYKLQLVGKLKIPNDYPTEEKLIFYARAVYPQQDISATGSAAFDVVEPYFSADFVGGANLFILILIPIAVIAVIIVTIIIVVNVTKKPVSSIQPSQNNPNQ